ncbi:MAG: thioredoxin-like domain-containing protein [Chitinophagaceae bacterium]
MNLKTSILFTFFLLVSILAKAQDGYSIKIDLENSDISKIVLSVYNGTYSKNSIVDSVYISSEKKQLKFTQSKKILGAIYQLRLVTGSPKTDNNNKINIAIDNGASLTFSINGNTVGSLETSQKLNDDFLRLQRSSSSEDDKKTQLMAIAKNYPSSVLSLWASFELKKSESNTLNKTNSNYQYRDNYFRNINLQDKRIPLLPNIYSTLFDYVSVLPITDSNYRANVDNLLKGMDCNSRNFTFYLEWVFRNLIYLQQYKLEKTYNYVYNRYLNNPACIKKDSVFYSKITADLNRVINIPIGSIIPSFMMSDSTNHSFDINSLKQNSDYTFIAFYDAECPHCKETMPKVSNFFTTLQSSKTVQKIAFVNPYTNNNEWLQFIHMAKLENWMNVKPDKGDLKYMMDLHLTGNPSFFLIDKTGKVILKTFDQQMLNEALSK